MIKVSNALVFELMYTGCYERDAKSVHEPGNADVDTQKLRNDTPKKSQNNCLIDIAEC